MQLYTSRYLHTCKPCLHVKMLILSEVLTSKQTLTLNECKHLSMVQASCIVIISCGCLLVKDIVLGIQVEQS